ncbi:hypothetical protein ACIA49_03560 [Kribbella sp. NPDC051587]|uniref:hypothetical protein n=1 Tax=Kribbella sp. NPDC051587 TaxID=3364119 RepID=UPI0037956352
MSNPHPLGDQCTATSKATGNRCRRRVIGGGVCIVHGGRAPRVAAKRQERIVTWESQTEITAWSAMTGRPTVEPGSAVLAALHMSWLRLHVYSRLLERQMQSEPGVTFLRSAGTRPRVAQGYADAQPAPGGVQGLIGHTYSADKQAGIFASGEAIRALVTLEAQERDRVVRYAKVAHDMGIAEREVRLAERQGELLAEVINGVLAELNLTPDQMEKAPEAVQRHLRAAAEIEGGDAS